MTPEAQQDLRSRLNAAINAHCQEHDNCTYVELIGTLEVVKMDCMCEFVTDERDDTED